MNIHGEDPFLCKDCQKLGYCRVRSIERAIEQRLMYERGTMQSPILSADPEPVPTFREFVSVHRPDLSRLLPHQEEARPEAGASKGPSLGALRAMIAARKAPAPAEEPTKATKDSPVSIPATWPKTPSIQAPRFYRDLRRYPQYSMDRQVSATNEIQSCAAG
jgi:hypothetical protein